MDPTNSKLVRSWIKVLSDSQHRVPRFQCFTLPVISDPPGKLSDKNKHLTVSSQVLCVHVDFKDCQRLSKSCWCWPTLIVSTRFSHASLSWLLASAVRCFQVECHDSRDRSWSFEAVKQLELRRPQLLWQAGAGCRLWNVLLLARNPGKLNQPQILSKVVTSPSKECVLPGPCVESAAAFSALLWRNPSWLWKQTFAAEASMPGAATMALQTTMTCNCSLISEEGGPHKAHFIQHPSYKATISRVSNLFQVRVMPCMSFYVEPCLLWSTCMGWLGVL